MIRSLHVLVGVSLLAACGDSGGATGGGSTTGDGTTSSETTVVDEPTTGGGTTTSNDATSGTSTGDDTTGGTSTGGESTGGGVVEIEAALAGIDGLTWEEKPPEIPGYRYFLLYYQQPADHDDPDGLQFTQHMTLLHRDAAAPMVISTEGYHIYPQYQYLLEPTTLLQANQLIVEHRFFADSRPEPADWGTLTIEQSAADHHRITTALQDAIYGAAWVSTGASKGGMTASYFRRFYPDDVAATVAYVAPLSYGVADTRYWPFLDDIGDPACTQALTGFRREVLLRRPEMLVRMADEAVQDGYTYEYVVDMDHALEVATLSASFAFWQYGDASMCPDVPTQAATDDEVWDFLNDVNAPHDISDEKVLVYEPYYFQAGRQLGAPGTDETALADLVLYPGFDVPAAYVVPGPGKDVVFEPAAMLDIQAWIASEATAMLFVYGGRDPWTAGAYETDAAHDVHKLTAPEANHGAGIWALGQADRAIAYERLAAWTGVTPVAGPRPNLPLPLRFGARL